MVNFLVLSIDLEQQPQNSPLPSRGRFVMNRHIPLLFQFFETTARVVTKAVLYAKSELCLAEPCVFFVKLGLIELLESLQYLFKRFGRIDIDGPLAIAEDELVHRLAAMDLSL